MQHSAMLGVLGLLLLSSVAHSANFAGTYTLSRESTAFAHATQLMETIYKDAEMGVADEQILTLGEHSYSRTLIYLNSDPANLYDILSFGNPLCIVAPQHFPMPLLPPLKTRLFSGYVNNEPVDVYSGYDSGHWIYVRNTTLGLVEPVAEAYTDGVGYLYDSFTYAKPPSYTWSLPDCYPLQPATLARDIEEQLNLPQSFSMSEDNGIWETDTYVDGTLNMKAYYYTFTRSTPPLSVVYVERDDNIYRFLNGLNISPVPCSVEYSTADKSPYFPPLTRLGTTTLTAKLGLVDIYTDGYILYLIKNETTPVATYFNLPLFISTFTPSTPSSSFFAVPKICFSTDPTSGTPPLRAPAFPDSFTMYSTNEEGDKAVIYHYGELSLTREDRGGVTSIQNGTTVWQFPQPNSVTSKLSPSPCRVYTTTDQFPIFPLPSFLRNVANGTVDNTPARVWSAKVDYGGAPSTDYWYLTADGTPLFTYGVYGFEKINFFQALPPPDGVFDLPPSCAGLTPMGTFTSSKVETPTKYDNSPKSLHKKGVHSRYSFN